MITTTVVVDAKLPNTTMVHEPHCEGKSTSKTYNHNVQKLVDSFVKDTKTSRRNIFGDRQFNHSYPNRNPGSPTGVSTCYQDLGRLDCWACLLTAKSRLNDNCLKPVSARVELQDCSITFNVIV
ncbi:hypothetical protein LINPERHAP2_LOCUS31926 [Linum perenne]